MLKYLTAYGGMIAVFIAIYIASRKATENQKWLTLTGACGAFCNLAYYYELSADSFAMMCSLHNLVNVLKGFSAVSFFMFALVYINRRNIRVEKIVCVFLVATVAILSTMNRGDGPYYTAIGVSETAQGNFLQVNYHPLFYIYDGIYLLMAADIIVGMVYKFLKSRGSERHKTFWLLMGMYAVVSGYAVRFFLKQPYDSLVIGYDIALMIFALVIRFYGLADAAHLAAESVIEDFADGLLVTDPEYKVTYANKMILEAYPSIMKLNSNAQQGLRSLLEQKEVVLPLGEMDVQIKVNELYDGKILIGYMAWVFDITKISERTREIVELKQEAEQANKAKSMFLADMSHEIRTPMNAVLGFSELLMDETNPAKARQYVEDIRESAKNLLTIINRILDISKIEAGKMEMREGAYNLRDMIASVSKVISYAAGEKKLEFTCNMEGEIPTVLFGASEKIYEILMNLLNNGVKYTHVGYVHLRVRYREDTAEKGYLLLDVEDSGQGMSPEYLQEIFDKFSRVDNEENRNTEGTGLGMAIVKGMLDSMGATIDIDTQLGKGTKIHVEIPQRIAGEQEIAAHEEERNRQVKDCVIPEADILVVDDNKMNLRVAQSIFARYDCTIDVAESGAQALEKMREKLYDIVFMDQLMPQMSGVETLRLAREIPEYASRCIVLLTANAIEGVADEMRRKGFDGYLTKPIDRSELTELLWQKLPVGKIMEKQGSLQMEQAHSGMLFADSDEMLHVEKGLELCGGEQESYKAILEYVCETALERRREMEGLYQSEDWENYTIHVHGLKSSMRSIGASRLANLAQELEAAGNRRDLETIHRQHEELLRCFDRTIASANDWIHRCETASLMAEPEADIAEETPLSEMEVRALAAEVVSLIREDELSQAKLIMQEMMKCGVPSEYIKAMRSLQSALEEQNEQDAMRIAAEIAE